MVTPSPVYLFKHVKRGTQCIKKNATSGFLAALECTRFIFGWGCTPHPAGGAYSAPPDSLAGLRGPTSKEEEQGRERGSLCKFWIRR